MKKINLLIIVTIGFLSHSIDCNAQFVFGVSSGYQINSASFGYRYKSLVPNFSLQVYNGSISLNESGKRHDYESGEIVSYEEENKFSGTVIIPTIGLKYYLFKNEKIKSYVNSSFTNVLLTGKVSSENSEDFEEEFKDAIKNIKIYSGLLGIGAEYFFDESFSVGGEFGFRMMHLNYKDETTKNIYNYNTGEYEVAKTSYNLKYNINPTYVRFSLNFFLQKNKE